MAGRKGQKGSKSADLPVRFSEAFLESMDGRTAIAKELKARLEELMADLGGAESLSYQQRSLAKRAVFLEATIESREAAIAKGETVDLGPLVQATNALIGAFRILGLQRKAKELSLDEVLRQEGKQ